MEFLGGIVEYGLKYIFLFAVAIGGIFIGKMLSDKKRAGKEK